MGIKTGTGMSLPFIPQSQTSDQSLIGIWDRGSGSGLRINGEEGRGEFVSRLLSVVMSSWSWARSMTPKSPAQSQDQETKGGPQGEQSMCLGRHWPELPTSPSQTFPRPSPAPAGETLAPRLLPRLSLHFPFGLLFHAALRQMHSPQIVLRASFSLEFLGPRTCEAESCMPVACSLCSAEVLVWLLAAQLLLLTVTLCASVSLPGYLFQASLTRSPPLATHP